MAQTVPTSDTPQEEKYTGRFHIRTSLLPYKAFYVFFWGSLGSYVPYLSIYFKQFGFDPFNIGLLNSIRPFLGFASVPVISALADRFQCRKPILIAGIVLGTTLVIIVAMLPPAPEVPCDVMERQIQDILHLNISLPYPRRPLDLSVPTNDFVVRTYSPTRVERRAMPAAAPGYVFPLAPWAVQPTTTHKRSAETPNTTVDESNQFPKWVQDKLFSNKSWLYDQDALFRLLLILFALSSLIDVSLFSSSTQCDTATLCALRREYGNADAFGWQRGFGALGWGLSSVLAASILNSTRTIKISCGIEHIVASYWTVFVCGIVISSGIYVCICYFKFPKYDDQDAGESYWSEVRKVVFSWHYGSIIIMIYFVGISHGCIWGFLFWHLENLGATQILLGMLSVLFSVSEFLFTYLSSWAINKFGHIPLMTFGLAIFIIRFTFYGLVTVPWMFVDVCICRRFSWSELCGDMDHSGILSE